MAALKSHGVSRLDQESPFALNGTPIIEGLGSIDDVASRPASGEPAVVERGRAVFVRGWALSADYRMAERALVVVDGGDLVEGVVGIPRPDVAAALGRPSAADAGFAAAIPTIALAHGSHVLRVYGIAAGRPFLVPGEGHFVTGGPLDPLEGLEPRGDGWAIQLDGVFVGGERVAETGDGITLVPGVRAVLRGWAVDTLAREPAGKVVVEDGGGSRLGIIGFERPDVVADLGMPSALRCGFAVPLLAPAVDDGLRFTILSADCRTFFDHLVPLRRAAPVSTRAMAADGAPFRVTVDDVVAGAMPHPPASDAGESTFCRNDLLWVRGWALGEGGAPAAAVTVVVDGSDEFVAQGRLERADVAAAFGNPALVACGFVAGIPLATLAPGEHAIAVRAIAADASSYFEDDRIVRFRIRD